ncbi:hypothetical protein T07_5041 [Trichinella nelsoni]|uniref:Uncharacterized protein n=1 Tax=Trichinella nelsoni TaxID=6336 RepID=A0A0V0RBX1_9BILA|nr:hypothetical protein T07_5041 [Trichinella nelsoni]
MKRIFHFVEQTLFSGGSTMLLVNNVNLTGSQLI